MAVEATAPKPSRKTAPGVSINGGARLLGIPPSAMRKAVALKEVETEMFAGQRRITHKEIERIRRRFADAAE
jgi:2,4-dienoyl-CoA reductase-like NADH-dependent reductase (Old Yellow Enzyme family)